MHPGTVHVQARIQDSEGGGGSYIQKGGGGRTGISGADPNCCRVLGKSTSKKKIADSRRGGGVRSPQKNPCIRVAYTIFFRLGTIAFKVYVFIYRDYFVVMCVQGSNSQF